jgi:hypothetical protein
MKAYKSRSQLKTWECNPSWQRNGTTMLILLNIIPFVFQTEMMNFVGLKMLQQGL